MKRSRSDTPRSPTTCDRQPLHQIPKWQDALAGACAGAFSKTAMAPVERVKLLMQLQGSVDGISHISKSTWQVTSHIYREEGILAFWRGNWPNLLRTAGQAALNFSLMDYYKSVALSPLLEQTIFPRSRDTSNPEDLQRRRQLTVSFVSGGLAGATSTTVLYPVEFLRTRLAMDQGRSQHSRAYKGMVDVIKKTLRSDGIIGLYQGYGIAVAGSILYRLLFLGGHDVLKTQAQDIKESPELPMTLVERFVIAQVVSLTAGTICYPVDSVRRRLMMQAGKPMANRLYRGSIHCFYAVWSHEGIRGFYLGLTPNLARSIGGALMLVAYDSFKDMY